jgi:SSS family solute:Na+ symporter
MTVFWLLVYVFVNLTSIIYLGAIAITSISTISFGWCIAGLVIFSVIVTLGGMKVIGYTDVIQVLVLNDRWIGHSLSFTEHAVR